MSKKAKENYIYSYYQKISDGTIVVGKWIELIYKKIINGIKNEEFYYDPKKANRAISFIENFVHHHEGELAPGLLKLELWQKALLSVIFGIVDKNGNRQFREVFIVTSRKCGKTLLSAGIAEYMLFMDGEYGARIYFSAPKLQQASFCYNALWHSIQHEEELFDMVEKRRSDIFVERSNSSAEKVAFNAEKAEGYNMSTCVADEIASWKGESGMRFYEAITSSTASRKNSLILATTTAGYLNDGIYDELFKRSTRVLLGDSKEKRLLPFLYMIDDVEKWDDITELQKSIPNLNRSVSLEWILDQITIAQSSLSKKAEFIVKYCNIKQNSSQAWLSTQDVEKASGKKLKLEDFKNSYCVGGIDLSQTTDLTACNVVIEKDEKLYVFTRFFLPTNKIEEATERDAMPYSLYIKRGLLHLSGENYIDYNDVFKFYQELVEKYSIYPLKIGYDRYSSQYLVQDMKGYGFHMDDVYQGDNLWGVLQECEGLIKDGKIKIGDNDLLKAHLLDSAIKMNNERGRGRLIKISNQAHIDGTAALADALCVRQKYFSEIGEKLKNKENQNG